MSFAREPDSEPIPGYRLIEPLGIGGFGEVWKCEAPGGLFKAIKFVFGNLDSLDLEAARAEQELAALQRIKEVRHPFVLSLDRIEVFHGELVIVMELADKSLYDSFLESQSSGLLGIPRDTLLRYVRDAAEALDHMNEKHNLQHLDVKPRNLFLVSDRVKVADFGLVKHLERQSENGLMGGVTPLYAAPETFNGRISQHSDQYSLAIVYEELLTGQRPFNGKNARQLAQQHNNEEPELRPLPEAERAVVARALSKDPAKRFPNCLAFIRALYAAQGRVRHESAATENGKNGQPRPKTLAETLEDIGLEDDFSAAADVGEAAPVEESGESSLMGMTMAQPASGALRPTVVVGMGNFGRQALQELRCRFLDRFGDLQKIPMIRFIYVDPDAEAIKNAVRGTPEVALTRNEVYHLPLQAVSHYRRRKLDHLSEWLPREKIYSIPRSLQTQGSRALGRLAFVDNHLRFQARLRREIQQATHADTLYNSVTQTGLALRDSVPRVYVVAAAGGGSSGFLVDLGYAVRRLLQQLRYADAEVVLFLSCGAPNDPATPRSEQANIYATVTELNHYTDAYSPFSAHYDVDGPRVVEHGHPFRCMYLLQMPDRTPACNRETVAHLGSYLFHELTTPLGLRLDRCRLAAPGDGLTPYRSFGTYAVWFPRGLLLRLAARQACRQLIDDWQAVGEPTAQKEVEAACARVFADSELRPEALTVRLEELVKPSFGGTPAEALTSILSTLQEHSEQSIAHDDPCNWARQALAKVREWVGNPPSPGEQEANSALLNGEWRKSRLHRAASAAAEKLAEEWDRRLADTACKLMEHPGSRVAAAEAGCLRFAHFCKESLAMYSVRWEQQCLRTQQAQHEMEAALENLDGASGGGWGLPALLLFGNRTRRSMRLFMDHLAAYARQCLAAEIVGAGHSFFTLLTGRLEERLRELTFVRQRLRHLREHLESALAEANDLAANPNGSGVHALPLMLPSTESFWESIRQSSTVRVVLPDNETDLERAASHFARTLGADIRLQLDQHLQDQVLSGLRGLHVACAGGGDLIRTLAMPLLDQASSFLSQHLPVTDVAQVELAEADAAKQDFASLIQKYLARATTLVAGADKKRESAFLLVPASESGKEFAERVDKVVTGVDTVRVPGQAHLMICREQDYLSPEDIQQMLRPCHPAYEESVVVPLASPHSRFDMVDWIPLDP